VHVPGRIARKASAVRIALGAAPCGLAIFGLIISCDTLQTVVANGDTRSLTFQHTHRDDGLTVTFKRNGRYDEDGLGKLNYFLRDWRNDEQTRMDPQLFDILWEVYREVDAREAIRIVSSYRSPETNSMLRRRSRGVAKSSQHMLGKAIDFNIPGVSVEELRVAGLRLQRGGVGFYPGSFVHVDVGSVRHWPRMTHDQLARVFPDGRTVHVPSDGQPLPGYALALADLEKRGSSPSGMSLAAARNSGALRGDEQRVASAGPKRNVLAKLFGFSTDDDEEEEASPRAGGNRVAAIATRPAEEARVPLPQARPATIEVAARNAKPGGFALASATSTPFDLGSRTAPRPPAPIAESASEIGASRAETTASINSWLKDAEFARTDRVSPDVALAYAASAMPEQARPVALAPPMPAARVTPPDTTQVARIPPKAGQRYNDPWLRGITLATSVHYEMNVTVYGKLDVRQVRMLMLKPASSIAMGFGSDPYEGMPTLKFAGAAVTFLPTVTYGQHHASLR
jgi:uncharacterized protein YcbK (DUF882 family)